MPVARVEGARVWNVAEEDRSGRRVAHRARLAPVLVRTPYSDELILSNVLDLVRRN